MLKNLLHTISSSQDIFLDISVNVCHTELITYLHRGKLKRFSESLKGWEHLSDLGIDGKIMC